MAEKLLLIDGNSLVHRAFHALPHLSTSEGEPTNAVYGLAQMLLNLLEQEAPDDAVVAFDAPGKTFRHEMYDEYKANRPPTPEELKSQWPRIRQLVSAMGLASVEKEGYEADDVIGTLARRAREQDMEVIVVSGDKDLLQLLDDSVSVQITTRGISETTEYDAGAFEEEYGIRPEQFADMKGLTGDSSDNIPGIHGVGPKTSESLLTEYRSIDEVYEHLDEISGALHDRLADNEEDARISKDLAIIETDVDLDAAPTSFDYEGMDITELRKLLMKLEFTKLLERLPSDSTDSAWDGQFSPADESSVAEMCQKARKHGHLYVVPSEYEDRVSVALCADTDEAVSLLVDDQQQPQSGLFDEDTPALPAELVQTLEDEAVAVRGARLKQLDSLMREYGVAVSRIEFDAEIADYLLTPQRSDHSVCLWAGQCMGWDRPPETEQTVAGLAGWRAHGCVEALATAHLYDRLRRDMKDQDLLDVFEDIEMPLVPILVDMEQAGIGLDCARLAQAGQQLDEMMSELAEKIFEIAGTEFNIDSPKQVGEVLFEQMDLPGGRRTKTGWSTAADVLEDLRDEYDIVDHILEYRAYAKLKGTYVDSLARETEPDTGLIHTTFEQTVAATGRLSSRGPNLQNIPIRTEWGRRIRSCFWSGVDGYVLIGADYSQIELRILAHMSGDSTLVEAFESGRDIHALTAALIFDCDVEEVDYDMRGAGKTVNYAILYGMGARSLAGSLDISREEAERFIENYHERLPQVQDFMNSTVENARETGHVTTLLGRRRPMPNLFTNNRRARSYAERAAANAPLQGTAADIVKIAMIEVDAMLGQEYPDAQMLLQVHDEIVLRAPTKQAADVGKSVQNIMESAFELDVPLTVDVAMGDNWRDMEPLVIDN